MYILVTNLTFFQVNTVGELLHLYEVYTILFSSVYTFIFLHKTSFMFKFKLIFFSVKTTIFFFFFALPVFEALLFLVRFRGEERRHTSKQTNKQKKNFCFIGSEAETHDVISDANVIYFYVEMNVWLRDV